MIKISERQPLLSMENISFSYTGQTGNYPALDEITLNVFEGQALGIVGESGSGKTTLARLIMHCMKPGAGKLRLQGEDLYKIGKRELKQRRKEFQMVFQHSTALNPKRSIGQSILEPLRIHRMYTAKNRKKKAEEWLDKVGLDSNRYFDKLPSDLSGGQLQLAAIARALVLKPKLLVCDEPVSALDVSMQAQVIGLLKDLKERLQLTLVFISHDLAVVNQVCEQTIVMYKGQICETGPTSKLFSNPFHPYSKALISAVLTTNIKASTCFSSLKILTYQTCKKKTGCMFADRCPEAMKICQHQPPGLFNCQVDRQVRCHLVEK
ncbi:MAG: ABC transporter ATP-binding protein [Desulfobacula sp.]|nr:ABC transporter ATP-binding protein [Desulfobacula sp.]